MDIEMVYRGKSPEWLRAKARELMALASELELLDILRIKEDSLLGIQGDPISIMSLCAALCGSSLREVLSKSRQQHTSYARQVTMYVLHDHVKLSEPHVGLIMGRDHSTVHYGVAVIRRRVGREAEFKTYMGKLLEQLGLKGVEPQIRSGPVTPTAIAA